MHFRFSKTGLAAARSLGSLGKKVTGAAIIAAAAGLTFSWVFKHSNNEPVATHTTYTHPTYIPPEPAIEQQPSQPLTLKDVVPVIRYTPPAVEKQEEPSTTTNWSPPMTRQEVRQQEPERQVPTYAQNNRDSQPQQREPDREPQRQEPAPYFTGYRETHTIETPPPYETPLPYQTGTRETGTRETGTRETGTRQTGTRSTGNRETPPQRSTGRRGK